MSDIVIFETESQQVEARLVGETLWVTQAQMAALFEVKNKTDAALSARLSILAGRISPDCPTATYSVIPAQAGIQLMEICPAKRDNMAVLSATRNVLLLDSRLRGNDEANE